ncbi:MAG TPA: preprotein translocase subunit SecY [Thermoleophilia bacterium]|nr:preprotein translocase subunit SecY [Thermoleophilia bacterium]
MIQAAFTALKLPDLRAKLVFTALMLGIFRIVAHIPMPGIDLAILREQFAGDQLLGFLNLMSGGALENFSVVALGVYPYITSSIIMQVMTPLVPQLREISKEGGEAGRRRLNQYTRVLTVPLAMLQGLGQMQILRQGNPSPIDPSLGFTQILILLVVMASGTVFLMWLGELITERGIGNGVSVIILGGIIAGAPTAFGRSVFGGENVPGLLMFLVIGLAMIAAIVFIQEAQRRVPVQYAKRIRGQRMYGGQSTHIPMKVNSAGMIPLIFAFSLMLLPGTAASYLQASGTGWLATVAGTVASWFSPANFLYWAFTFILVVAFTYFYTLVIFQQQNLPEALQKNGGFIPGIRPGKPTADYLSRVLNRLTLAGGLFLATIAVVPFIAGRATGVTTVALSSTGLLIVVGVVLDTMKQLEAQLLMRDYESFLR